MTEQSLYMPATAPQQMALDCEADLLLFGGSAGSLKSHTLLLDAMQERDHPYFRGMIFRRTFPELTEVIDKGFKLYKPLGCEWNEQKKVWTWPSGARLRLGYMENDRDVYNYWGQEYSWIGFDESTMHTEQQIRTILSRLRTPYPGLKCRARLATNPGGPGASGQQQIFLRGACPVHEPEKCAVPGKLYYDRVWPSDGKRIPFSVAFIPGKLSDHNLLGPTYVEQLRMQKGALADQLEQGCWCQLEGVYFKCWDRMRMVVPYADVGEQYWHTFFISIDYGVGSSSAAAGLYVKLPPTSACPKTRTVKIGEICEPDMAAYEFAELVAKAFIEPEIDGKHRRNIQFIYADQANFNPNYDKRAVVTGLTVSDEMNRVFNRYGLSCAPSSNDRIGGWQHLYRVLNQGDFLVADNCPITAESIRTRLHAEKKPGDIEKVEKDPLDDVADETRYALYSFPRDPEKPKEMIVRERMAEAPTATDAMITRLKVAEEFRVKSAPQFVGAGARRKQQLIMARLKKRPF